MNALSYLIINLCTHMKRENSLFMALQNLKKRYAYLVDWGNLRNFKVRQG